MAKKIAQRSFRLHLATSFLVFGILSIGIFYALGTLQSESLDSRTRAVTSQQSSTVRIFAREQETNGATDWSSIDEEILMAKKKGIKIIFILESAHDKSWYERGYKQHEENSLLTYPEYVRAIVTRYKDEPTIFGWLLTDGKDTSSQSKFTTVMREIITSNDPNHSIVDAEY